MRRAATQAIGIVYDRKEWIFALEAEDTTDCPVAQSPADWRPCALHEGSMSTEREVPNVSRTECVWNVVSRFGAIDAERSAERHLSTVDRTGTEHELVGAGI